MQKLKKKLMRHICLFLSILLMNSPILSITTYGANAPKLSVPMVGIDVSSWNKEIDWAKVKAAGVEFAMVRIFHHLANTSYYELDEQFERNVREAQKYGIRLGAYFFSYAQNLAAVTDEANMVVNELNKYPGVFSFPIVFDAEDGDTTDDPEIPGKDVYDIGGFAGSACKDFCDILSANGYYPMVYSYTWYFKNKIGLSNVKDYDIWLASYPRTGDNQIYAGTGPADAGKVDHSKRESLSSYDDNVTMWQYTGAGKVNGINYGDGGAIVDLNVSYIDYPSIIMNGGYNGYAKNTAATQGLTYRTGANGPASSYKSSKYYTHVTSVNLTGDGVTDTLAVGLSQLGYYEGTTSNKYGGLYNTWDDYPTNKTTEFVYNYGDADKSGYKMAWCASFCSWSIYQSRTANLSTHDQSCRNHKGDKTYIWRECSCYQWADQLKRFSGMYKERGSYTPKSGDLIFFKMDGGGTAWTNHIGFVRYCDGSKVYTLEGNRHNHVILTSYSLSDSQICGYGRLPYPTNNNAPKVDYSGKNKTAGQYITDNATLSVSKTKGGSEAFSVGKYDMFDVTGFDGNYAIVSYKGNVGYATLSSKTIQVTAVASSDTGTTPASSQGGMNASVNAASILNTSFAAGPVIPEENCNNYNPNVYVTGLRENTGCYKGLENYGTNKEKIIINGRTWDKWECRPGAQILNNIWIYGMGDGKAYMGIDIGDSSRLRVKGENGHGEEIQTIVIKRGFEIVKTSSDLWGNGEISSDSTEVGSVVGIFKENVILVANDSGGFDITLGGSDSMGLEGYSFQTIKPKLVKFTGDAYIRTGPDTSYTDIGIGVAGSTYEYLDDIQNSKWLKIDYKGKVGWVSNVNAVVIDAPQYVSLTGDANIRSGPGTDYSSLGTGTKGTSYEYLNEIQNEKWLKVSYNGKTGWISNVNATLNLSDVVNVTAENRDWEEITITHSFGEWIDETRATCTECGKQKRTCYICQIEETRVTDALGHDFGEWHTKKEPTFTEYGERARYCSRCDAVETDSIPKLSENHTHDYSGREEITKDPTCTESGIKRIYCANPDCGEYITETIFALGHNYNTVVTNPTCTESGYTMYICSVCGESYIGNRVSALGHNYNTVVINPTCTDGGYTVYTCSVCGESHIGSHTSALSHNYNTVIINPTCTENGYTIYTCSRCGENHAGNQIDALGHKYIAIVTNPTCTKGGYTTYTCSRCADSYEGDYTNKLGHDYVATVINPTCTEGGYTVYTCSRCADSHEGDYTNELGHDYVATVTNATCTESGGTIYTCSRCADSYKANTTAPLGHSYNIAAYVPAKCTESGYTAYRCSKCGDIYKADATAPLGHNYVTTVTDPTCVESGYTTYRCIRCGESHNTDATAPLGHLYTATVISPTCTESGYTEYVCIKCGESHIGNQTNALSHDYNIVVTNPTCEEGGYTVYTCKRCGENHIGNETSALGHDFGEWIVTKPATTDQEGIETRFCKNDHSHFETRSISKLIKFIDVPESAFYAESVNWAVSNGITNGTGKNTFSPDLECTRGQVVTLLWRAAGSLEPASTVNPFMDVKESDYFYKAVLWAVENGITSGTSRTVFSPNARCTRGQVVAFLWRANGQNAPKENNNPFTDVMNDAYYYKAMLWAIENNITNGVGGTTFLPAGACTRSQVVTFLYRAFN